MNEEECGPDGKINRDHWSPKKKVFSELWFKC